jgi:hypothetical protein
MPVDDLEQKPSISVNGGIVTKRVERARREGNEVSGPTQGRETQSTSIVSFIDVSAMNGKSGLEIGEDNGVEWEEDGSTAEE